MPEWPDLESNGKALESKKMAELTVLYDGSCSLCRASVARVRPFDKRRRIEFLDLHDPSAPQRFPLIDRDAAMRWMQAVDPNGRVSSGADAWARIGALLPGWNLLVWILLLPGLHWLAVKVYAWIARNRYRWNRSVCSGGTCALHVPNTPGSSPKRES